MKFLGLIFFICVITACSSVKPAVEAAEQQRKIYKSWVLSRCIASVASSENDKQDALNTASTYLEISQLSVEDFTDATPLIEKYAAMNYQGSIPGTFNTKKCIDLLYSPELDKLFNDKYKKYSGK